MSISASSTTITESLSNRVLSPPFGPEQQLQIRQKKNSSPLPTIKKDLSIIRKDQQKLHKILSKKSSRNYSELEEEVDFYSMGQFSTKMDIGNEEREGIDHVQIREKKTSIFNMSTSLNGSVSNLSPLKQNKEQTLNKNERREQTCPNYSVSKEEIQIRQKSHSKSNKNTSSSQKIQQPFNLKKQITVPEEQTNKKEENFIIDLQDTHLTQDQQTQQAYQQSNSPSSSLNLLSKAIKMGHAVNTVLGIISLLKVVLNIFVLSKQGNNTSDSLFYWVLFMMAYDMSYIIYLVLSSISMNRCTEDDLIYISINNEEDNQQSNLHSLVIEYFISRKYPINFIKVQQNAEKKFPYIMYCGDLCRLSYMLIFLFGNILIISQISKDDVSNSDQQTQLFHLGLLFLIFGYIYLSIPLIACIAWPTVTIIQYCIESCFPKKILPTVNPDNLLKLNICNFQDLQLKNQSANNLQECVICQVEYQQNDRVITLPCNNLHYFHENCCKQWLLVKGECPICRQSIDQAFCQK